jgi:Cof subfamily protein (haloacid dehalogenase superfamily)
MQIKHIFSDLDGTLLNSDGSLSVQNITAVKQCLIPFTLVSARSPKEMLPIIDTLHLTTSQVAFNGGLVFKKKANTLEIIHKSTIDFAIVQKLVTLITEKFPQASLSLYDLTGWYSGRVDAGIRYSEDIVKQNITPVDYPIFFTQPKDIFKLMMINFDHDNMKKLNHYLNALNIKTINIQQSTPVCLEITSQHAKKSTGIQHILKAENLTANATAALGDGYNDLPMLELVGYPIVMANAFEDLKKKAHFITKTNNQAGVSYALQHIQNLS